MNKNINTVVREEGTRNIFSLNLLAYLKTLGIDYRLELTGKSLYYAVVEDSQEISQAILDYKYDEKLQAFLSEFRDLRKELDKLR